MSCVRIEAFKVNSSKSGVLICGREDCGERLHRDVGTGPGAMEFGHRTVVTSQERADKTPKRLKRLSTSA